MCALQMRVVKGSPHGIGTDYTFGVLPTLHVSGVESVKEVMSHENEGDLVVGYPPPIGQCVKVANARM